MRSRWFKSTKSIGWLIKLSDLVIIAQSRRDQFELEVIENIQSRFGQSPIVAVLGSWCEGEMRSGHPWPGVIRIYWHQWAGRYEAFTQQMESHGISSWHVPRTSSRGGSNPCFTLARPRIQKSNGLESVPGLELNLKWFTTPFESFDWESRWVERCVWDATSAQLLNPICIEADSLTPELEQRIAWLRSEYPSAGFVMILNFPRINDVEDLAKMGIAHVVSKPFELNDLQAAIISAFQGKLKSAAVAES